MDNTSGHMNNNLPVGQTNTGIHNKQKRDR